MTTIPSNTAHPYAPNPNSVNQSSCDDLVQHLNIMNINAFKTKPLARAGRRMRRQRMVKRVPNKGEYTRRDQWVLPSNYLNSSMMTQFFEKHQWTTFKDGGQVVEVTKGLSKMIAAFHAVIALRTAMIEGTDDDLIVALPVAQKILNERPERDRPEHVVSLMTTWLDFIDDTLDDLAEDGTLERIELRLEVEKASALHPAQPRARARL